MAVSVNSVLALANHGFFPVRLHYPIFGADKVTCSCGNPKCDGRSRGKHPVNREWGRSTTQDSEVIEDQWSTANWNVGIVLGICHGIPADKAIIDIEDDTPEGRELAETLLDGVKCPTYTSGKSLHRLFRWSDDLPPVANMTIDGLEFRFGGKGKETQSMAPPSIHFSGTEYKWIDGLSPEEAPLERLPQHVIDWLQKKYAERETSGPKGISSTDASKFRSPQGKIGVGGRHHSLLIQANHLWRRAFRLYGINGIEEQKVIDEVWMDLCGNNLLVCDPPKSDAELHVIFTSSQRFMAAEFEKELAESEEITNPKVEEKPDDPDGKNDRTFGGWLARHGIRMRVDDCGQEVNPSRIDEWVSDWTVEYVTRADEDLVSLKLPKREDKIVMKTIEFEKPNLFARKVQQETNGEMRLDVTFPLWDWASIWIGRPNDKKKTNGITRGLREYLVNSAKVVEQKESGLAEQVEDLVLSMAGPKSALISAYESYNALGLHKFTGRLKFAAGSENLSSIRLPEDSLTGFYPFEDGIHLFVKIDEVNKKYRGAYGGVVTNRQIVTALESIGFVKKRLCSGGLEGRWFCQEQK